jgi:UDP-GlcNAc:undecaprenyl-phosphate GlcNAc-1-phosphate transferase
MGLTQREAVLILCLVCGALGVLAIFITQADLLEGYVIGGTVALTGLLALVKLERVDVISQTLGLGEESGNESEGQD